MKKTLLTICIVSGFLAACNNSNDSKGTESTGTLDTALQNVVPSNTGATVPAANSETNTGQTVPGTAISAPPSQQGSTAVGKNPPHGQPGHRCDIEVGEPLNSKPFVSPVSGTTVTPSPVITAPTNNAAPPSSTPAVQVATPPGMNPPHGQPGHDCSVAVGAPLKK